MKRDALGGGQPCGLAAALARARRPPKAGGGPTKYHRLALGKARDVFRLAYKTNTILRPRHS